MMQTCVTNKRIALVLLSPTSKLVRNIAREMSSLPSLHPFAVTSLVPLENPMNFLRFITRTLHAMGGSYKELGSCSFLIFDNLDPYIFNNPSAGRITPIAAFTACDSCPAAAFRGPAKHQLRAESNIYKEFFAGAFSPIPIERLLAGTADSEEPRHFPQHAQATTLAASRGCSCRRISSHARPQFADRRCSCPISTVLRQSRDRP